MIVRRERPADHDAVRRALHEAAFRPPGGRRLVEARLVDELREDAGFLPHLSLVAVDGGAVVGHVIATRGWLEPLGHPVLGLGPLGVHPDAQGHGVGTALVHALLAVAEACDERLVALLGVPGYYRRFGFVRPTEVGVEPPDPAWGGHFQARQLAARRSSGTFRYADPFPAEVAGPLQPPAGKLSLSSAAADLALADRHLLAAGQRAAGHRHAAAAQRAHPPAERVDLGGGEVAGQLHDVAAELAQRDLALVVADDDVVDRGVADDAGDLLLLLREQAADPARHALGDQDHPGPAEHPVDGVQLRRCRRRRR